MREKIQKIYSPKQKHVHVILIKISRDLVLLQMHAGDGFAIVGANNENYNKTAPDDISDRENTYPCLTR